MECQERTDGPNRIARGHTELQNHLFAARSSGVTARRTPHDIAIDPRCTAHACIRRGSVPPHDIAIDIHACIRRGSVLKIGKIFAKLPISVRRGV